MKTAIEIGVEYLEAVRNTYLKDKSIDPNYEALIFNHISVFTKLIEVEKQQIIDAFISGINEPKWSTTNSEQYYQTTFKAKP